jgi:hypothetical protein
MATPWSKIGGGSSLIKQMEAVEAKEVALKNSISVAEEKFKQKFGMSPSGYLLDAQMKAYKTASSAQGLKGRSAAGVRHTNEPPQDKETKGAIKEYHDLEDEGKACAKKGDLAGAITKYTQAADKRVAYEVDTGKAPDAGHAHRVVVLRERRKSLVGLKNDLDTKSPDVVAAKLVITNFFKAEGVDYTI